MVLDPRVHGVILKDLWRVHGWVHGPGGWGPMHPCTPWGGSVYIIFTDFQILGFLAFR